MTNHNYPNLMCFGNDIVNCPLLDKCPDYQACEKRYRENLLKLFDTTKGTET